MVPILAHRGPAWDRRASTTGGLESDMVMITPFVIMLSDEPNERSWLPRAAFAPRTSSTVTLVRARIVLAAADGTPNADDRPRPGVSTWTPSASGAAGSPPTGWPGWLTDPGPGARRCSPPCRSPAVKALACTLPAERGRAAVAVVVRGTGRRGRHPRHRDRDQSASTVRRWLAADAIKPWQHRSWIFPRDPDFAAKAARVLDLYDRVLGRAAARPRRVRDQRRREVPTPGPAPPPPRACRPGRAGPGGSSSSTTAAAPWPTSPPTTCTTPA